MTTANFVLETTPEESIYVGSSPTGERWGELTFYGVEPLNIYEQVYAVPNPAIFSVFNEEVEEWLALSRQTLASIDQYIDDLPEEGEKEE